MNTPKDNLEDFFHQSFRDSEIVNDSGDWNLPSDAVWEGIQDGMTEERKLSFVFLKWPWSAIAASYLLLMGGYQFLDNNSRKNDLTSATPVTELLVDNDNRVAEAPCVEDLISKNNEVATIPYFPIITENNLVENKTVTSDNIKMIPVQDVDSHLFIKAVKGMELQEEWTVNALAALNIEKVTSPLPSPQAINLATPTPVLPSTSNAYVALNFSPTTETLKAQDLIYPLPLNADQTEIAKGKSIGIDVGLTNNKGWSIETGIHYTQMAKETLINQLIPTPLSETDLTIEESEQLTFDWSDAYGQKEVDFNIKNTTSIPPVNVTALNMKLTQKTKSHFIDIPILVRKNWVFGKLNISAKTGLLNRFNVANSYEAPTLTSEDNRFELLATEFRQNTVIENNRYVPQLVAGIGLEYFIQPNLSVYVEPTFSKSLRPVIDFSAAAIHSENKALTMGMRYHL